MVRLFIRHRVADYDAWRKVYDDFDAQRRSMGVTGDAVFRAVDDANDVTVSHDFDAADAARTFTSSDALRDAMQSAGVEGQPETWIAEPS
jgi:hypothetical protein